MNPTPAAALVVLAEALTAGYLALITWLMSCWMMDDSRAFRMTDTDWLLEGGRRLAVALLASAAFTVLARLAHRRWVCGADSPTWLRAVPLLLGAVVALAGAAGSVWFVVTRPYM